MERIVQEIEYGIMVGEFHRKERLVENDLMQRFSVGRGIIRDALKILADRGLVSRNENKGATVFDLSAKEIRDLYFLRSKLEGIAGELAFPRITAKEIQEMSRLKEKLEKHNIVDRKLVKLHEAFHEIIFKGSGNDFLFRQSKLIDHSLFLFSMISSRKTRICLKNILPIIKLPLKFC